MSDIEQGDFAKVTLGPGDTYRVTTSGVATVQGLTGAPATTTTVTANSQDFGPYGVNAVLKVTATTGTCTVRSVQDFPVVVSPSGLITGEAARSAVAEAAQKVAIAPEMCDGLSAVLSPLQYGDMSASVILIGDSTGDETNDWFYRSFAEWFPQNLPDVRVEYEVWDDAAQDYSAIQVINAGEGERGLQFLGTGYLIQLPGDVIARSSADHDVSVRASLANWNTGALQIICGQIGSSGNRGWRFQIHTTGKLQFEWSPDGTNLVNVSSTNALGYANNTVKWLRATLDVDNGSGGYTATLYASDDGVAWTNIGSTSTSSGTTSVYSSTSNLTLGAAGGSGFITGTVYKVRIRDGIYGPVINAQPIDSWYGSDSANDTAVSVVGAPTLHLVNGSRSGAGLDYFTDAARIKKMLRPHQAAFVILSTSHNDPAYHNGMLLAAKWDAFLASVKSRLTMAAVAITTQNPRNASIYPSWARDHTVRTRMLKMWAARNGCATIDFYLAFKAALNAGATLGELVGDGIHPTKPAGVTVQVNEMMRVLSSRLR